MDVADPSFLPSLRLTRRGRALLSVALAVTVLLVAPAVCGASSVASVGARTVVVEPRQTLSHVAARELPALPLGTAVAELQLANRLNTTHVHAGQVLRVPEIP